MSPSQRPSAKSILSAAAGGVEGLGTSEHLSPSREALVATAGETIARGSKSFRLASRLFDRTTRERAWLLYAWCRHCDDISDGQTLGHDATG
jgi:phytoene synthase